MAYCVLDYIPSSFLSSVCNLEDHEKAAIIAISNDKVDQLLTSNDVDSIQVHHAFRCLCGIIGDIRDTQR